MPIHGGPESPARLSALAWLRQVHQGGIVPLPHLGRLQDLRSLEETLHKLEVYIHLWRALPEFDGEFWDFPHFAVSGRLVETV